MASPSLPGPSLQVDEFELAVETPEPVAPNQKPRGLGPGCIDGEAGRALMAILNASAVAGAAATRTAHQSDDRIDGGAAATATAGQAAVSPSENYPAGSVPVGDLEHVDEGTAGAAGAAPDVASKAGSALSERTAMGIPSGTPDGRVPPSFSPFPVGGAPFLSSPFPEARDLASDEGGGGLPSTDLSEPRLPRVPEADEEEGESDGDTAEGPFAAVEDDDGLVVSVGRLSLSSESDASPADRRDPERASHAEEGGLAAQLTPLQNLMSICKQEVRMWL